MKRYSDNNPDKVSGFSLDLGRFFRIPTIIPTFCRDRYPTQVGAANRDILTRFPSWKLALDKDGIASGATANQKFNALKNDHRRPTRTARDPVVPRHGVELREREGDFAGGRGPGAGEQREH